MGTVRLTTIALALCGALALSAAGCGDDDSGDSPSNTGNDELLTTDGFQAAYDAVSEEVGSDDELVSVQIAETGATFTIGGSEPRLFTYTGGELVEGEFQVIGPGQGGGGFPFTDLDPGAIDEIIAGVTAEGAQEVTTMTLETGSPGPHPASSPGPPPRSAPAARPSSSQRRQTARTCSPPTPAEPGRPDTRLRPRLRKSRRS